jgi:hypothetical protein
VVASGAGDYDFEAIPVALLRNQAATHFAVGVVVRFTVHSSSGTCQLDAQPISLAPGGTLAVAALCDYLRYTSGAQTDVSVTVARWSLAGPPVVEPASATYACGDPCSGVGGFEGDASATLVGTVAPGTPVHLFAACMSATGSIVGGGITDTVWGGEGSAAAASPGPQTVRVPVLTVQQPASCEVYGAVAE